jgi:hypothetical protein
MAKTIRREVRRRGFFGWVFLILFLGWNALMAFAMFAGLRDSGEGMQAAEMPDAYAAGTAIGVGLLLVLWAVGSVIFGLLALLTRGPVTVIEEAAD